MIRLSKSSLDSREKDAVCRILDSEFLGMGKEVGHFESDLKNFFQREVVCVASGTAALHLALQALDIKRGDEVLIQSLTYVASFQAIAATGATPVPCDVNPSTLCINLSDAKKKLSNRTRAIMPIHYAGKPQQMSEIMKFAKDNGLRIIEDSAHAFGSYYKGKKVGSFGDITCFSFDGIKNITSGEGGCVVSNDEAIIQKVKDARLLGVQGDSENRVKRSRSWQFDVAALGWRYHMSDIMAAIGRVQLQKHDTFSEIRKRASQQYTQHLKEIDGIYPIFKNFTDWTPHIYPVKISEHLDRETFRKKLLEMGVETGFHYLPNHLHSYFQKLYPTALPNTEQIACQLVSLPLHVDLNDDDLKYVCDCIREILP